MLYNINQLKITEIDHLVQHFFARPVYTYVKKSYLDFLKMTFLITKKNPRQFQGSSALKKI
jgi:hypothetical protein